MNSSVVEKLTFGVATWALYAAQRVQADILLFAAIDLVLAVLFMMAWMKTRNLTAD